ncbi:MAG: SPOR domain-containing protein [Candidatus Thiodiazotropha lotti]|nr:SPOR domain-containing protein [Candidatus Thiodiazotropha lotti]MCW4194965.1 SPOR domain-containing protein [Candidatus Thiodiazotropha lotti]MCW4198175.1 SPOR domain-containing protein [Candidatus Thiodiazotropha lotti]MCW4203117.1 SPOR domain-containing protein [Candidatus Thiodiazotropha lotti]MCW4207349.1 SPOR domain-containing protein [Candidatus Thiodiazotropha lotti]
MALEERLKQRMLGGAVLVALVVIFVPMLIDEPVEQRDKSTHAIPIKPQSQQHQPVASQTPDKPEQKMVVKPAAPKAAAEPVSKPKPEPKPKPILSKKPVEKSEPKQSGKQAKPRPSPTAWIIQVASLTNENNAKKLVQRLRKAELPAQMAPVKLNGKPHYRVRVGPEVDHRLAEKMLAKIKREFKLNPKLMRYPE